MAIVISLWDTYSDIYKDVYGVRPHTFFNGIWHYIEDNHKSVNDHYEEMDKNGSWLDFELKASKKYWEEYRNAHSA